jgi:hypothetical protein
MTLILAFVLWAFCLIAVILGSFYYFPATTQEGLKDFFAAATIGCTAVTAALGALVSTVASKDLEAKRQQLQTQLQDLKSGSDRQMEMMKATTLSREIEAYQELFSAAAQYYTALSKLETNAWKKQDSASAEIAMQKARSKTPYLKSDEHRKAWEAIWTKAALITSLANKINADQQSDLWSKSVGEFGTMLQTFEKIVSEEFPRPQGH